MAIAEEVGQRRRVAGVEASGDADAGADDPVDAEGAGEIPLAFPEKATATLTLPADAEGQVLVVKAPARAVVAELQKRKGAAVQVAVAPGRYQVLLRTASRVVRCDATAGPGAAPIDLGRCRSTTPAPRRRWRRAAPASCTRSRRPARRP